MTATKRILYKELASTIQARLNCAETMQRYRKESQIPATARPSALNYFDNASKWFDRHTEKIEYIVRNFLPSGSGWDMGTKIDLDKSHADRIVLYGGYHHMDENGYYGGWTNHVVTVTPSLQSGFNLRISGRDRNEIKDYLADTFSCDLQQEIEYNEEKQNWKRST